MKEEVGRRLKQLEYQKSQLKNNTLLKAIRDVAKSQAISPNYRKKLLDEAAEIAENLNRAIENIDMCIEKTKEEMENQAGKTKMRAGRKRRRN
jgi:hypothetical protein